MQLHSYMFQKLDLQKSLLMFKCICFLHYLSASKLEGTFSGEEYDVKEL